MKIKQIKVGFDNFSYIIFDSIAKKAVVIDPSTNVKKTLNFIKSNNLDLKYIINTHYHRDHTNKNKKLKELFPKAKIVVSEKLSNRLDSSTYIKINESSELKIDSILLKFLLTPGHTPDGLCITANNKAIFTGDTLFIDDCGRADLHDSDIKDLFESLQKIKNLPDNLIIYPGHDYGSKTYDKLKNQIKTNKTLIANSLDEFKKI